MAIVSLTEKKNERESPTLKGDQSKARDACHHSLQDCIDSNFITFTRIAKTHVTHRQYIKLYTALIFCLTLFKHLTYKILPNISIKLEFQLVNLNIHKRYKILNNTIKIKIKIPPTSSEVN